MRHGRPPGQLEEPLHAVLVAAGGRQRLFLLLYFVEEGRLGLLLDRVVVAICILVLRHLLPVDVDLLVGGWRGCIGPLDGYKGALGTLVAIEVCLGNAPGAAVDRVLDLIVVRTGALLRAELSLVHELP